MELTVLGIYGPYPPAGGATSGYLLQSGTTSVLLECGSGILSRLQQFVSIDDIDAVVLSHLHGDHTADMQILRYMLPLRKRVGVGAKEKIRVYSPSLPEEEYDFLCSCKPFDVKPVFDGMKTDIGGMRFKFYPAVHPYPGFGMRVEAEGKIFAFSGDTNANPRLPEMICGADAFLCDCAFLHRDKTPESTHLSVKEAGELAAQNGVKTLIMTHLQPFYDKNEVLDEAKAVFPHALMAQEMESIEI